MLYNDRTEEGRRCRRCSFDGLAEKQTFVPRPSQCFISATPMFLFRPGWCARDCARWWRMNVCFPAGGWERLFFGLGFGTFVFRPGNGNVGPMFTGCFIRSVFQITFGPDLYVSPFLPIRFQTNAVIIHSLKSRRRNPFVSGPIVLIKRIAR